MSWPKASLDKEELLSELLEGMICEKKHMFGAPVYFANHSMFAGVFADDVFLRLSDEDRARFVKENRGAKAFEPMEGKRMREYVIAPHALLKNKSAMRGWLSRSIEYASTLKKKWSQNEVAFATEPGAAR